MVETAQLESPVSESRTSQPESRRGPARILSLDAFRGLVMVLMLDERMRLPEVARSLIQPAFSTQPKPCRLPSGPMLTPELAPSTLA